MAPKLSSAALVGCTGLVGSNILTALLSLPCQPIVQALTRRELPHNASALNPFIEKDSSKWPEILRDLAPTPDVLISAVGTTRRQAGNLEAQRRIDYDLNLALAKAAKAGGINIFVLISSAGTSAKSSLPYSKMKGELEVAVKELGIPYTVILRPGLVVGSKENSGLPETIIRGIAKRLGSVSKIFTDWWAQDAGVVGKAAVLSALRCIEGTRSEGIWTIDQAEVVKLGRTEWKDA